MDVIYYSNNCKYCQKLLAHLAKIGVLDKYNFVCIDRRSVDPNTRQITITLDRGVKTTLPPNISRVPTLLLVNQKYTAVIGDDIYTHVDSKTQQDPNNLAFDNGGEPIGFIMSPSSGGVNIVSETYTMYNAPPEELSAKGNGGTRQMHNYASAKIDSISMPLEQSSRTNTIEDVTVPGMMNGARGMFPTTNTQNGLPNNPTTYNAYSIPGVMYNTGQMIVPELQRPPPHRHTKLGEDVTLDSIQQKRNLDIQNLLPQVEVSNVQPPRSQAYNPPPPSQPHPLQHLQKLNATESHRIFEQNAEQNKNKYKPTAVNEICYL